MVYIGRDTTTGQPIELTPQARQQGVYVIGTTGTGKTSLLRNVAYQDMTDPTQPALIVLDPHGDLTNELLTLVPEQRQKDVILFAPGDLDQQARPLGLNMLACDRTSRLERQYVMWTVVNTLRKLYANSWGPRLEDLLRHSVLTLMETEDTSLLDLLLILASYPHRRDYLANLEGADKDPVLRHYWEQQFPESYEDKHGNVRNPPTQVELVGSTLNKVGRFLVDPLIRHVVAQSHSAFRVQEVMDEGKILLVNLSKGNLGEDNSSLLGSVIVNLILIAALRRGEKPGNSRHPVHLIVDEYQSFATETFPTLQSEARKYGIDVLVAHQYRDQLDDLNRGSTLNVANFIVMRVSGPDSTELAMQFDNTPEKPKTRPQPVLVQETVGPHGEPLFVARNLASGKGTLYREVDEPRRSYSDVAAERANELAHLDNYEGMCRLIGAEGKLIRHQFRGFKLEDFVPLPTPSSGIAKYIRRRSVQRGTELRELEAAIRQKMANIKFGVSQGEIPFIQPSDNEKEEQ